jgi:hypothetical protein
LLQVFGLLQELHPSIHMTQTPAEFLWYPAAQVRQVLVLVQEAHPDMQAVQADPVAWKPEEQEVQTLALLQVAHPLAHGAQSQTPLDL